MNCKEFFDNYIVSFVKLVFLFSEMKSQAGTSSDEGLVPSHIYKEKAQSQNPFDIHHVTDEGRIQQSTVFF